MSDLRCNVFEKDAMEYFFSFSGAFEAAIRVFNLLRPCHMPASHGDEKDIMYETRRDDYMIQ